MMSLEFQDELPDVAGFWWFKSPNGHIAAWHVLWVPPSNSGNSADRPGYYYESDQNRGCWPIRKLEHKGWKFAFIEDAPEKPE